MLDVVFNHTAEGNEHGPTISFRGLDNRTYYMLTPEGYYYNFTGTGNTLNCNNPVVRNMVLDCLRYWAAEYHIDGFRFDLAAILGRDPYGAPLANPPLLESLAYDPILAQVQADRRGLGRRRAVPGRLASPPTAAGRSGTASTATPCAGSSRATPGMVGDIASAFGLARPLLRRAAPAASINFITCHDGFTLRRPGLLQRQAQRGQRREQRDGANDNN